MIAFVFPGQGAQRPGMLHDVAALPGGAETLREAEAVLACDVRDDEVTLATTLGAQRALAIAGVASARALDAGGVVANAVAGHSIGAFAAAVTAGALAFADALRAVDARARAMASGFPSGFTMGAVGGLTEAAVRALAAEFATEREPLYAANVNAVDQIALAGARSALERALAAAIARGARTARLLDVAVPSHTPLMDDVARTLARTLADVPIANATCWYAANRDGRLVRNAAAIRRDLIESVARPVRWADATQALVERGVTLFIEALPGNVLTDLAVAAYPNVRAVALANAGLRSTIAFAALTR
ncbi:MAG: malonate decarboxylase subunit epsilon [Vulcanimicrobiaceae bacterium]